LGSLQQTELPCPRISAGERSPTYPGSGFWTQPGISGPNRNLFIFAFSVPRCLRGAKVFFGLRPCHAGGKK